MVVVELILKTVDLEILESLKGSESEWYSRYEKV